MKFGFCDTLSTPLRAPAPTTTEPVIDTISAATPKIQAILVSFLLTERPSQGKVITEKNTSNAVVPGPLPHRSDIL